MNVFTARNWRSSSADIYADIDERFIVSRRRCRGGEGYFGWGRSTTACELARG